MCSPPFFLGVVHGRLRRHKFRDIIINKIQEDIMGLWSKGLFLMGIFVCIISASAFGGEKIVTEIDRTKETFIKVDQDGEYGAHIMTRPMASISVIQGNEKDLLVNSGGTRGTRSGLAFNIVKDIFLQHGGKRPGEEALFPRKPRYGKTLSEPVFLDEGQPIRFRG